jgi:hypothetical protein
VSGAKVPDYEQQFAIAVSSFWSTKASQLSKANDAGTSVNSTSGSVRAGKHMDAFEPLILQIVNDAGIVPEVNTSGKVDLPGYYREFKSWDVVLQYKGHILAIIEAKSQGSSLANNFNNRVEEAIGQAADVWKSHERGRLVSGLRPWVGYIMIVENTPTLTTTKHLLAGKNLPRGMTADPTFDGLSYAARYATAFRRLDQERMLDAACFAVTNPDGSYHYPDPWLSFNGFAAQLWGRCQHALAVLG